MSLIATRLQNFRIASPNFDRNMVRPQEYGALDFFVSESNSPTGILSPELKERAFASMGSTVEIPVIDYDGDVTVANVRSCTITDDENTSALYTIVWATFAVGFTMTPSLYLNNEISYQQDWNRKIEKVSRAMADSLDEAAVGALEARKTQVLKEPLYYAVSGNSVQVPWDMREDILSDLNSMERANEYPGMIHLIGNAGVDSMLRKMAEKGLYNEVNKQLEYSDKVLHFTNNVVNEEGVFATLYAVTSGNVGLLTRVDRESLLRSKYGSHEWDVVNLPYLGIPVGSHYYTSVGDRSNIAGAASADMTCVGTEYYGFSVDVSFLIAYNSDPTTIPDPIIKAEVAKSSSAVPTASPVYVVNDEDNPVYTSAV